MRWTKKISKKPCTLADHDHASGCQRSHQLGGCRTHPPSRGTALFPTTQRDGWATCPLTENATLRILGRPGSSYGLASPTTARALLRSLLATPGHQFWSDDVSLMDTSFFPSLPSSKHLTDLYLLALAVKHGGRLATFDVNIDATLIPGGQQALYLIPNG